MRPFARRHKQGCESFNGPGSGYRRQDSATQEDLAALGVFGVPELVDGPHSVFWCIPVPIAIPTKCD
jgi:hypothetical protein